MLHGHFENARPTTFCGGSNSPSSMPSQTAYPTSLGRKIVDFHFLQEYCSHPQISYDCRQASEPAGLTNRPDKLVH
jgi:hypothetical protein